MKKLRTLMIAAAAGMLLASCNKDEGTAEPAFVSQFPEDGVIRVTTNVNEAILTRAGLTTDNLSNFYLNFETSGDGYDYFQKITKDGDEWKSESPMLWKDDRTPVSFSAAVFGDHEFTKDEFVGGSLVLPEDQSAAEGAGINAADLLRMPSTIIFDPASETDHMTTDGKLKIALNHALTKIDITLTLANEFQKADLNKAADLTDFTVGSYKNFSFSQDEDGYISPLGDETINVKAYRSSFTQGANSVAKYECIVVPTAQYIHPKTKLAVSFKIGEKTYTWTSAEVTLEHGYKYAIELTAGSDAVTTTAPGGFTATPWTGTDTPTNINTH